MISLTIRLDGDDALKGTPPDKIVHVTDPITVAGLTGGMTSGKPSVALLVPLPDGRTVVAETSLALFLTAADALRSRHGDPR